MNNKFADKLRHLMNKKKLTGKYIAEKMGVTKGAVINWANGSRFPKDEDKISDLVDILDCTTVDLFPNSEQQKAKIIRQELQDPSSDEIAKLLGIKKDKNNNFLINSGNTNSTITTNSHNNTATQEAPQDRMLTRLLKVYEDADEDTKDKIYFDVMKYKNIQA